MPFNLVHGMNAILHMDFFDTYSLRVATNLEWTRHELSQRIYDLEKLDETQLMVVGHMYTQKRQKKQHHNLILKPKKIMKGDLILVYKLKPHIGKFKKRGFGPCVAKDISSCGAIKLSTLNGESMSNWISGSRIKINELPLITNDMLECMHDTRNRKEVVEM